MHFSPRDAQLLKDATITHNHPNGNTFSQADLNLAYSRGVSEIRACHKDGCYVLTRNFKLGDTIPANYSKFAEDYGIAIKLYMKNEVDAIFYKTNDANRCNEMVKQYKGDWIKKNASKYGWTYKEEK